MEKQRESPSKTIRVHWNLAEREHDIQVRISPSEPVCPSPSIFFLKKSNNDNSTMDVFLCFDAGSSVYVDEGLVNFYVGNEEAEFKVVDTFFDGRRALNVGSVESRFLLGSANGSFTIREAVNIKFPTDCYTTEDLRSDYRNLLEDGTSADFFLECQGVKIPCHRLILAARSPVFKAMFDSGLDESRTNTMKIEDMSVGILQKFLRFIYCGDLNTDDQWDVVTLFEMSDKYDVKSLSRRTQTVLVRDYLEIRTAAGFYTVAFMHNGEYLKEKCANLIIRNRRQILKTGGWRALMEHPSVSKMLEDLFQAV